MTTELSFNIMTNSYSDSDTRISHLDEETKHKVNSILMNTWSLRAEAIIRSFCYDKPLR